MAETDKKGWWSKIKALGLKFKQLILYGSISVFVTVIDIGICLLLENFMDKLLANAIGILTGFIIEYFIASKKVWDSTNRRTFVVYIGTFLVGFTMAQGIIWICRDMIFGGSTLFVAFIVSKGLSIVIPFFVMFGLRKFLIKQGEKHA